MKKKAESLDFLAEKIREIANGELDKDEKLKAICKLLRDNVSHYDWVGFYLVDKTKQNELILGAFEGEPTEHERIQFGKGICGQAAQLKRTFVVQDVSKETSYLSCSLNVKSEIVMPIFKNGKIVGELDIDSHTLSAFTHQDEVFLGKICKIVSKLLRVSTDAPVACMLSSLYSFSSNFCTCLTFYKFKKRGSLQRRKLS